MSAISRTGRYVKQEAGYQAFIPAPLPPSPPVSIDQSMVALLSRADLGLGRLDGVAQTLPHPELFVAMYVRREAVYSSQIEGTQSSLDDLLAYELDPRGLELPQGVEEVVNYVRAMNYGLGRLSSLPLSLRLIRELHEQLLGGVRGADRHPGEFRTSQNWIGPANASLSEATFVPPPAHEMTESLYNLESFLHDRGQLPVLIHAGVTHAQFETIHPFLDGNGRVGRLLIAFLLVHAQVLHRPLLYLSHFLKKHRAEYYDRLMAVREDGDWEGWLKFFLRGVAETAEEASATARETLSLRQYHSDLVQETGLGLNGLRLLEHLYQQPLVNVNLVKELLDASFVTANKLVEQLVSLELLEETTGGRRNRVFRYSPFLDLLEKPGEAVDQSEVEPTQP